MTTGRIKTTSIATISLAPVSGLMSKLLFALLCGSKFLSTLASAVQVSEARSDSEAGTLSKGEIVEFEQRLAISSNPSRWFPVELGEVDAGVKTKIRLLLENDTSTSFEIKDAVVECSCTVVEGIKQTIPVGGVGEVIVLLDVPKLLGVPGYVSSSKVVKTVALTNDNMQLHFELTFELRGVCCFKTRTASFFAGREQNVAVFRLPALLTPPVDRAQVRIAGTGDFEKVKCRFEEQDSSLFVRCEVAVPNRENFTLGGSIFMVNPLTEEIDSVECFVGREKSVIISPSTIRWLQVDDEWIAVVMIRLNREIIMSSKERIDLNVKPEIHGETIHVDQKSIGSGLSKITIRLSRKPSEERLEQRILPEKIKWMVSWTGGIAELESQVLK